MLAILTNRLNADKSNTKSMKIIPKKSLGQNYLRDKNIVRKMLEVIAPKSDDNLIEIGPGLGALTNELNKIVNNFTAIEIDQRVISELQNNFADVNFINDDFLKIDLRNFYNDKKLRIVGNIPYNLTSPIIFKMIHNRNIISDSIMMIQNEVALRLNAKPKTKDYGILSVILNYFGSVKYCFKVPPTVFFPKPKVDSAVVHISFKEFDSEIDDGFFISVIKAAFNNRRKTLKNSLSNSIFANTEFNNCTIDTSRRAEELTTDEFIALAKFLLKETHNER